MRETYRWVVLAAAYALGAGCAGRLPLLSATDSGASSDGSGNSSAGSSESSQGSSESSNQSVESSQGSKESSGSSGESFEQSSEGTTRGSGESSAQVVGVLLSTSTLAATTGATVLLVWLAVRPSPEAAEVAHLYLRANQHQLEEDLALGAGRGVEDLAALARIRRDNFSRFARLMRAHRHELMELSAPRQLTAERAVLMLRRVGELCWADPVLAEDGRRAVEAVSAKTQSGR